jgi:transcriptional regulator with XRE-family HTH domain
MDVATIKERTKWAINYIVKKEHLSNIKLAEKMKVAAGTINTYRRMTTVPNIEFILKFCEMFHFSLLWFIQGIGYPFPKAWETYPESKGPVLLTKLPDTAGLFDPDTESPFVPLRQKNLETYSTKPAQSVAYVSDTAADYQTRTVPAASREFRVSEALTMVARVLESETSYATALYLNIQHFDRVIATEARIAQLESSRRDFEASTYSRLQEMEGKIEQSIKENKLLQLEVNRLKATCEGQDAGRDSLTKTPS